MRTYAIGDLHGRFDLLCRAIDRIDLHRKGEPATFVVMGDFIDRGPQSRSITDLLMNWNNGGDGDGSGGGLKLVVLKGNHEDIMVQCIRREAQLSWWIKNGGGATLASFGYQEGDMVFPLKPGLADAVAWAAKLPVMHVTKKQVFVHAFVNPAWPLEEQLDQFCMWQCYDPFVMEPVEPHVEGGYPGKHVVHGHQQWAHGPILLEGRTNLDTHAYYTGRLAIGVFDDSQGKPVEILWAEE